MQKGDIQCPQCQAGFRRIEITSMRGEPGEYRCPHCRSIVERFSGHTYVAYWLTVQPEKMLQDTAPKRPKRPPTEAA
jgi:transposase-like protein